MNKDNLHILVLNNQFYGSYESNQVFYSELVESLRNLNISCITAETVDEAVEAYEKNNISFSICFSKYGYFIDNIPLYDSYNIPHYQWVSDNPIKMNIDEKSNWITYIFIDNEFILSVNKLQNEPLILPLGFMKSKKLNVMPQDKIDAVLMPCKIRSLSSIKADILNNIDSDLLNLFIEKYDLDSSFISYLNKFKMKYSISEENFRLVNEYIRVKKRIDVVKSIKSIDVYIVGDDNGNFRDDENVYFIDKVKYSDIDTMMSKYKYVLNVDPNYHSCFHDRFIRAINSGTVCITNYSNIFNESETFIYRFSELDKIDDIIKEIHKNYIKILRYQRIKVKDCEWTTSLRVIIDHFHKRRD